MIFSGAVDVVGIRGVFMEEGLCVSFLGLP